MREHAERRARRASEGILGNESLAADLGGDDARFLLDWGLAAARQVALDTDTLADEIQAEAEIGPRLRAVRRLMRLVNRWVRDSATLDDATRSTLLGQVIEQAAVVYGGSFAAPTEERRVAFIQASAGDPAGFIRSLRSLLENRPTPPEPE
ncbi:MAG: hypothetical protein FJZ96_04040 [Chloroflexi bacterium]|nr:hypothetical protein [Chloroflexota bacterium]